MDFEMKILEWKAELAATNAEMWEQVDAIRRGNAEIREMQAEQRRKKSEPVKKNPPPPETPRDIEVARQIVANMYGNSTLAG